MYIGIYKFINMPWLTLCTYINFFYDAYILIMNCKNYLYQLICKYNIKI